MVELTIKGKKIKAKGIYEYVNNKNEEPVKMYFIKYKGRIKRGFKTEFDAYQTMEGLKSNSLTWDELNKERKSLKVTLLYVFNEMIKSSKENGVRYGTIQKTEHIFNEFIIPNLPNKPIDQITAKDIENFKTKLNAMTYYRKSTKKSYLYSSTTKNDILTRLSMMFEYAIDNSYIERSPCRKMRKFAKTFDEEQKEAQIEDNLWTFDEAGEYVNFCGNDDGYLSPFYKINKVIHGSGIRLGEALAIRVEDVLIKDCEIRINKSLTKKTNKGSYKIDKTKNESSKRFVIVAPTLYKEILSWIEKDKKHTDYNSDWFLFHKDGNGFAPIMPNNLDYHRQKTIKEHNLKYNTTHKLRHIYNTFLKDHPEIPEYDRNTQLGHSTKNKTNDIYSHVTPDGKEKIKNVLEQWYQKGIIENKQNKKSYE